MLSYAKIKKTLPPSIEKSDNKDLEELMKVANAIALPVDEEDYARTDSPITTSSPWPSEKEKSDEKHFLMTPSSSEKKTQPSSHQIAEALKFNQKEASLQVISSPLHKEELGQLPSPPLHVAIMHGQLPEIKSAADKANLLAFSADKNIPLSYAVTYGCLDGARHLILEMKKRYSKEQIQTCLKQQKFLLSEAIKKGYQDIAEFLVDHGADVNALSDAYELSPLMLAIEHSFDVTFIEKLINARTKTHVIVNEITPLYSAVYHEREDIVILLCKKLQAKDLEYNLMHGWDKSLSPLDHVLYTENSVIARTLALSYRKINPENFHEKLQKKLNAYMEEHTEREEFNFIHDLMCFFPGDHKESSDTRRLSSFRFHNAIVDKNIKQIKVLEDKQDLLVPFLGEIPLACAINYEHDNPYTQNIPNLLIHKMQQRYSKEQITDCLKNSSIEPLYCAIKNNSRSTACFLLEHIEKIEGEYKEREPLVILAIEKNMPDSFIKTLIKKGANTHTHFHGETPLYVAIKRLNDNIATYFCESFSPETLKYNLMHGQSVGALPLFKVLEDQYFRPKFIAFIASHHLELCPRETLDILDNYLHKTSNQHSVNYARQLWQEYNFYIQASDAFKDVGATKKWLENGLSDIFLWEYDRFYEERRSLYVLKDFLEKIKPKRDELCKLYSEPQSMRLR